ncbi:MAG: hypothetical protein WD894_00300 [Pirellulales bacterium]
MSARNLAIHGTPGKDGKVDGLAVVKALEAIQANGATAGDWIKSSLDINSPGDVMFEAFANNEKFETQGLAPYDGPTEGEYDRSAWLPSSHLGNGVRKITWYRFGRVQIGEDLEDNSYVVVRVRQANE